MQGRLVRAVDAWELDEVRPLPGGNVALVCAAMRDAHPVVLKINPRGTADDAELASEGAALAFWRLTGAAVELLGRRDGGFTLLLERALPGDSLASAALDWDEKLVVLGRLAARLHGAGAPPADVIPMSAYAAGWRDAGAELDGLLARSADDVLVHADLHPGNALCVDGSWKAIDPHGARGDRHAEIWALICPEAPALPGDPAEARRLAWRRLRTYAEAAGLDPNRAAVWARVRAVAEAKSPEAADDPAWAECLRRTARALATD
jgi:streptomycin 6-kinase